MLYIHYLSSYPHFLGIWEEAQELSNLPKLVGNAVGAYLFCPVIVRKGDLLEILGYWYSQPLKNR